jgi:hypothetical protein
MLLKLYWEAQETIPTTYPRIQYAIEAVLGSAVDDAYTVRKMDLILRSIEGGGHKCNSLWRVGLCSSCYADIA